MRAELRGGGGRAEGHLRFLMSVGVVDAHGGHEIGAHGVGFGDGFVFLVAFAAESFEL